MLTNDLPLTYEFLKNLRDYHYEKLYVPENPSGILLCQKHAASFRWKRRIFQDDLLVASPLHKTDQALAEKLETKRAADAQKVLEKDANITSRFGL